MLHIYIYIYIYDISRLRVKYEDSLSRSQATDTAPCPGADQNTKTLKFLQACLQCAVFRSRAAIETFVLLKCDAASLGGWCLSFRESAVLSNRHAPITDIQLDIDAFADEESIWARKVCRLSPGDEVPKFTETKI